VGVWRYVKSALGLSTALAALAFVPASADAETLYNQICCGNEGTLSQSFAAESKYSVQLADDFVIPSGETWSIEEVISVWTTNNADPEHPPSISVLIYGDNSTRPGSQLFNVESNVAPKLLNPEEGDVSEFEVPVSVPTLGPGRYWLSLQAHGSKATNGEWFWGDIATQNGPPAVLRNPGDGFETGCTEWTARELCSQGLEPEPDQSFILRGSRTVTPPPPPPPQPQPQAEPKPSNSIVLSGSPKPGKRGGPAIIDVQVPGPGIVTATGDGVKQFRVVVSKAGEVKIKVRLKSAGKKKLKSAKGHKLKVNVKVTFTPTGGEPKVVKKKVTFEA
jgi:hypothetical protein